MTVRFHPAARDELRQARLWYEERSPLSAVAFEQEVVAAVSGIAEAPMRYPVAEHGTRRLVLRRFPYNVFWPAPRPPPKASPLASPPQGGMPGG